jgi:hypothetical protein
MKRLLYILIILSSALLVSCLPEPLEVKGIPKLKPKIAVSSHLVPNEGLVVMLTKSFGALDADDDSDPEELLEQIAVTDAVVIVRSPNRTDTLVNLQTGFYGGVEIPFVTGDKVDLIIMSESLGTVQAQTEVQKFVDFETIEADLSFNGFDDTLVQITYEAFDPIGPDQYLITVQRIRQQSVLENLLDSYAFVKLQNDEVFDGKKFGETFRAFPRNYQPGDTVAVTLSRVSEEYFEYLTLRRDNRFSWTQFLGEPVNYGTNVQGGLGYFNLNQPAVRLFVLEE